MFIKYRKGRKSLSQSVVPAVEQVKNEETGHMSETMRLIHCKNCWLSVDNNTKRYYQTCALCAVCKDPRKTTTDSVCTSQPTKPCQEISMDLKRPIGSRPRPSFRSSIRHLHEISQDDSHTKKGSQDFC